MAHIVLSVPLLIIYIRIDQHTMLPMLYMFFRNDIALPKSQFPRAIRVAIGIAISIKLASVKMA